MNCEGRAVEPRRSLATASRFALALLLSTLSATTVLAQVTKRPVGRPTQATNSVVGASLSETHESQQPLAAAASPLAYQAERSPGSDWLDDPNVPAECRPVFGALGCLLDWSRADLSVGTTGFTGASNFLTSGQSAAGQTEGSFGFQESVNFGSCLPDLYCGQLGAQLGLRAVQSQLDGSAAGNDARHQLFVTSGLFRRVDYGVQGGLVVDYLHDDWLLNSDLVQLRGELGFMLSPCHDAGFRFTSSLNTSQSSAMIAGLAGPVTARLNTLDTYRFFYRCRLGDQARSTAELNAGFSEDRDAILGLTLAAPLQGSLGINATTSYLLPHSTAQPAYAFEGWNVAVGIVWTPGRNFGCARDYYRPLFDVADNGSLFGRRL